MLSSYDQPWGISMYVLSIPMATWHYVGEMEYMQLSPKFSSASYYLKPFSLSSEICLHFLKMWIVLAVFFPKDAVSQHSFTNSDLPFANSWLLILPPLSLRHPPGYLRLDNINKAGMVTKMGEAKAVIIPNPVSFGGSLGNKSPKWRIILLCYYKEKNKHT